ncbi:MAG: thioredoxin fold domain-containing protein [Vitreoscilla sp.]|nr:thioredoxin fold domain-containing protein [Vitreoscilla sp.]
MKKLLLIAWSCLVLGLAPARAQEASPHAIEIPSWFTQSFLELNEDVADAARAGKRGVMVYFGQDGCPYCARLMKDNFGQAAIADKTRQHFTAIALNLWGDREVAWLDGRRLSEKSLAQALKVQFTPTLIFLGTDGKQLLRLDGYQPPERFEAVLDFLIQDRAKTEALLDFLARREVSADAVRAARRPYLLARPTQLQRQPQGKPLAVLFETQPCKSCDEMHGVAFTRPGLRALLKRFDIASLSATSRRPLTTPDGRQLPTAEWARSLQVHMNPTVVFFDNQGREVFRFDSYLRPFHIEAAFAYVAEGAYRTEPQFQRYVQVHADKLRAASQPVDLWR